MFRIPGKQNEAVLGEDEVKDPVILWHGFQDSAGTFLFNDAADDISY